MYFNKKKPRFLSHIILEHNPNIGNEAVGELEMKGTQKFLGPELF